MSRFSLFLVGLLICVAAFGGLYYRTANDPGMERRVNWALEKVGLRQKTTVSAEQPREYSRERSAAPRTRAERRADRRQSRQQDDQLELFKLGLDLANIVVGLIGIYLAASSMRSRRDA
jgi:hypothetical protein